MNKTIWNIISAYYAVKRAAYRILPTFFLKENLVTRELLAEEIKGSKRYASSAWRKDLYDFVADDACEIEWLLKQREIAARVR